MVVAGLLLLAIGLADLLRPLLRARPAADWAVTAATALAAGAVALGCGAPWPLALVPLVLGLAWPLSTRLAGGAAQRAVALLPIGVLALVVAGLTLLVPPASGGVLVDLWRGLPHPVGLSGSRAVLALGLVLFLLESSNVVVRAALRSEALVPGGVGEADGDAGESATGLRGGRLIGPVERLLVGGLALTGAFTAIAALIAAKGIVRFPEISRDRPGEDKSRAEYFLVGTIVSWALAFGAAALLWATAAA